MQTPVEEQPEESTPDPAKTEPEEELDDDADETAPSKPSEDSTKTDDSDLPPDAKDRTKKAFTKLREKAAFGNLITDTLVDAKITPDEFARWTGLAARLKKGDPTAVTELINTAKAFGYKEPTVTVKPEKTVDDIADEIFRSEFKDAVDDLEITEPLARKQARKLAELQAPARTKLEVEQPVENKRTAPLDPVREHALAAVEREEKAYEADAGGESF